MGEQGLSHWPKSHRWLCAEQRLKFKYLKLDCKAFSIALVVSRLVASPAQPTMQHPFHDPHRCAYMKLPKVSQHNTCLSNVMNFTAFYCIVFSLDYSQACLMACILDLEQNRKDGHDSYTENIQIFSLSLYIYQIVFFFSGVIFLGVQSCVL